MNAADADAVATLVGLNRGRRPASLTCAEAEDVLTIALALAVELGAANDRIDRLEREMARLTGRSLADQKEAAGDADAEAARAAARDAMLARVLRIMIDPRAGPHDPG
ncbi:MAG: hypothetical protein ACOYJ6_10105 [Caulobacterales bacterium]|jgi:hypothetical protein